MSLGYEPASEPLYFSAIDVTRWPRIGPFISTVLESELLCRVQYNDMLSTDVSTPEIFGQILLGTPHNVVWGLTRHL